jgi:hypothetical protein
MMDQNTLAIENFQIRENNPAITSVIPFLNHHAVLLSFAENFEPGVVYQLALSSLRDTNRTALRNEDSIQNFLYNDQLEYKPYVKSWHFEGEKTLILQFNRAMDPSTVLSTDNYSIEPDGYVLDVEQVQSSHTTYRLEMSQEISLAGRGVTVYLSLFNLRSATGVSLDDGNRFALIRSVTNIADIVVFPQPLRTGDEALFFANIPYGTSIRIYNLNGQFITNLRETDQNGGIRWDMRDKSGKIVSNGIYIYQATFQNENKIGKFTIVK